MAERALEMLLLPPDQPSIILDIGCGSGISGGVIEDHGHFWVGMDISPWMLLAAVEREVEGDMILSDMGDGFKFRPGSFDGCISISALQWLCNSDKKGHEPYTRLRRFFQSLFNCLKKGARAVMQFYPECPAQIEMITSAAIRCGFGGGLVVDYPHSTKAKKHYLVIYSGSPNNPMSLPKGLQGDEEQKTIDVLKRGKEMKRKKKNGKATGRQWVLEKKEHQMKQGKEVRKNTKFTGRKRRPKF
eukprot:GEMP01086196.1.p1 GENE.GEMP01086196.1~~GEMP01086196.1.p1  ORF type:complete len:244 (+),score=35.01 GEMP01086196.1:181-912(+)